MTLAAGAKLGRYEIVSPLGAGGMGEVYRARDTRLGRDVAVKVLPSHLSGHPERKQRFEREAKAISQLKHPSVCTLHDVGSEGEVDFLVMELLEGQTLAERLANGALPVDDVLALGSQIANGLAAAHRRGIVHRDLKPGNIMLTRSGAKLLDFGLARIAASPAIDSSDVSSSPTESVDQAALTRGRMIGTLQYMAPEQIEGKTADTRTDVFALGAVLYEMLTGTRAFGGSSPPSLMAAILTSDPGPLPAPATNAPPALERLIRTCLAKDPDDRWQSAHDISLQLESMGTETGKADARQARARWPYAGWILLGPALVAVAATALVGRLAPPPPALPIRFPLPPPPGQTFVSTFDTVSFAFSPDGTSLAFIADAPHATQEVPQQPRQGRSSTMIWLRRLSDLEPHPVLGSEGATSLFWSPDGRSIGFSVEGRLRRVEVAGGSPAPICDLPFGGPVIGSWGHDTILLASTFHGVIYTVSPDGGGPPTVLIRCDPGRGETRVVWPYFLPDGKTFLYVAGRKDGTGELMMASLGGPPRAIGPITSRVEYSDPGYLFFAQDGALFAQRFDTKRGRLTGPPLPLAPTVHYFYTSKWAGFAVSRGGALAYAPKGKVSRLAWFDRSGQKLSEVGSAGAGNTTHVSISPDRRQALFDRTRPETGTFDVWMIDLVRGVETRVTSDPNTEFAPVWLPDGRHVVYSVVKEYLPRLVLRDLTDGREEPLLPGGRFQMALDVTPDGRSLLFSQTDDSGTFGLWKLPLVGDRTPLPLVVSKYEQEIARLSRDGRLLAYVSNESGRPEAYVAPLRSPNDKVRLSTNGATGLGWSRDSREVFFTSRDGRLFAMPVVTSPSLRVGAAVPLFDLPAQGWSAFDVAPDGRFLASVQEVSDATEPLTVALNWTEKTSRAIESSGGR